MKDKLNDIVCDCSSDYDTLDEVYDYIEKLEEEVRKLRIFNKWRKDTIEHVDKKLESLKDKKYAIGVKELETIKYLLGSDD